MEGLERHPGNDGHGEKVGRPVRFPEETFHFPVAGLVGLVGGKEVIIGFTVLCPQAGEGVVILVKNGVAWVYHIIVPQLPFFVKADAVAFMAVFHHRKEIEHGGIGSLFALHHRRYVQIQGHAVETGHFVREVGKIFLPVPAAPVDGYKCHGISPFGDSLWLYYTIWIRLWRKGS